MPKRYVPKCIKESLVQLKLLLWKNIVAEINKTNFESFIMLFELLWAVFCWFVVSSDRSGKVHNKHLTYDYTELTSLKHGSTIQKIFYYPNNTFATEIMLIVAFDLKMEPDGKYIVSYKYRFPKISTPRNE